MKHSPSWQLSVFSSPLRNARVYLYWYTHSHKTLYLYTERHSPSCTYYDSWCIVAYHPPDVATPCMIQWHAATNLLAIYDSLTMRFRLPCSNITCHAWYFIYLPRWYLSHAHAYRFMPWMYFILHAVAGVVITRLTIFSTLVLCLYFTHHCTCLTATCLAHHQLDSPHVFA
jgi:hypothetical protein